jgi:hypothetical protein
MRERRRGRGRSSSSSLPLAMLECSKDVDDEETLAGCERRAAGLQIPVYIAHRGNVAFVEEARVGDYGGDGVDELLALVDCDL